jgi:hypothetical protein
MQMVPDPPPAPIVAEEAMLSPLNGTKIDRAAIVAGTSRNNVGGRVRRFIHPLRGSSETVDVSLTADELLLLRVRLTNRWHEEDENELRNESRCVAVGGQAVDSRLDAKLFAGQQALREWQKGVVQGE